MKPKNKKRRVIIEPENVLPFDVSPEALVFYKQDEYKYLIHYARSYPEGMIPIVQYLLLRFHPLIIKISGHYFPALDMEWRDLISFTRQKFIELVYRFNLCSSLYFRTYIQTALRRAIYDRVLFESRRKALLNATSLDAWSQNPGSEGNPEHYALDGSLSQEPEYPTEDFSLILEKVIAYVAEDQLFTLEDRHLFKLRFLEGCSLEQIRSKLGKPNFYIIARQRYIREHLIAFAQKYLI